MKGAKKVMSRGKSMDSSNKPNKKAMGGGTYSVSSSTTEPSSRGNMMVKSAKYTGGPATDYEA